MLYEKLYKVMEERNISQRKLSMVANISNQDLNQAINGKKPFFPNWKIRISEALDIPVAELFPEDGENSGKQ